MLRVFTKSICPPKVVLSLLALLLLLSACSASDSAFTDKVAANPFVAELYGNVSETLTINHANNSHVSWMGLMQGNDYQYFKVTKVQAGTTLVVSDGVDIAGTTYTANSNAIIKDITVGPTADGNNEFVNGSINVAGDGSLKVTVEYSPLIANNSTTSPHEAYLIVYYDSPSVGALRIKLQGYTDGVKNEKCARAVSTLTPVVYSFNSNQFGFYFCGDQVAVKGQNNIATLPTTDADYHGQSTNLTEISTLDSSGQGQFLTFYQVDDETVCLLSQDLTGADPSIPEFIFPIPDGLAPISELDIQMAQGSFAECTLDGSGGILCDSDLLIDTGVVPVSALTATNGTFSVDDTVTTQCTDFGALTGSGTFGSGTDLTLVMKGTVLSDSNTQSYNIVDALVAAKIQLKCESGCD